jgi:hypothetical protein
MAQVYPFSYQQRHPEWKKDPWTQGGELMAEQFKKSRITFSEAFKKNPGAIWEHVMWHFRLLPAGMQWGLFNGHFGEITPDFAPARSRPVRAAVLSVLVLAVIAAGTWLLWQRRARLRRFLKSRRIWSWLALFFLLPPCVVAIITQRPRPSYIFPLTFFVMALTGLCLYAILRRLKLWRYFQAALPVWMALIIIAAAPEKNTAQIYEGQPLKEMYERLAPFSDYMQGKRRFASREFTVDFFHLVNRKTKPVNVLTLGDAMEESAASFQEAMDGKRVAVLYLTATDLKRQGVKDWLASEDAKKWNLLAQHERDGEFWMLLNRSLPSAQPEGLPDDKGK